MDFAALVGKGGCAEAVNFFHVASGGALTAATAAVGGALIGGAVMANLTSRNVADAAKIANQEGKSGMGMLGSVAKSLWDARQDAKMGGEKALSTRTRSEMQERLGRSRMSNEKPDNSN